MFGEGRGDAGILNTVYRDLSLIRNSPSKDPTVGVCLGPCGGSREVGVDYERGTPVIHRTGCSARS